MKKQINIEIKGVQFSNKGAELMLIAIIEQLEQSSLDYQLILSPGPFLPYTKRAKLGAWQKLSFRRGPFDLTGIISQFPKSILNFIKRYGIVTEKDVDVILDGSGFAYGQQWGTKSLIHTEKELKRFQQSGKKYIFLPQAFGPFEQQEYKTLAKSIFTQATLVFPRDSQSFEEIINCGINPSLNTQVIQSPDFTCLVEPKPYQACQNVNEESKGQRSKTVCFIPNNKMVSTFYHDKANTDKQSYLNFYIETGKYYQSLGWDISILNHEGEEDHQICREIAKNLKLTESQTIKEGLSALDIKAYIGSVDAVVSSRYHGCVSALSQGVPCLATSWSHKYQTLFSEYSLDDNVLNFKLSPDELLIKLALFTDSLSSQKTATLKHAEQVKQQSKEMWRNVFVALSS